jgi:hypothetical protein
MHCLSVSKLAKQLNELSEKSQQTHTMTKEEIEVLNQKLLAVKKRYLFCLYFLHTT